MAFFRGEEGSVSFDNGTGSVGAVASTTAWTLDTTKDTLECTAHGDTSRKYVGSLITATGTVEDAGDAAFNLFLDTSGSKKLSLAELLQELHIALLLEI